jgi:sigma-B regulation protein RsbU (phosphoserine phosphatase)
MTMTSESLAPFAADPASQELWRMHLERIELPAGARLFTQGDPADAVYFIERGELVVVLELPDAGRVPVRTLGIGQCVGEMALYRHELRAATVEARLPAELWRLSAAALARLEREHPEYAVVFHRHLARLLAERVAFANSELKEPLARLAHAIRGLAESHFAATGWDRPALAAAARRVDEVGAVAGALTFLEAQLRTYLEELRRTTAQKEQIESELRIAGQIQASFLPPPLPPEAARRVDFAATMRPAREAGGDFYDGFFLDDRQFFFAIGDVSGKGVSAALFMAVAATGMRAMADATADPGRLFTRVNRLLCQRNDTGQFVTLFAGVLDTATGGLVWCDCGHPPVFVVGPEGVRARLDDNSRPPLGAFEEVEYPTHTRLLAPDETVVLYTDGVSEALNTAEELYGDERLCRTLAAPGAATTARTFLERVLAGVLAFAGPAPQADDITIVTVRRP